MDTNPEIAALLADYEKATLDFKKPSESQAAIAEQIAAFANAASGRILFGVAEDDEGNPQIVGIEHKMRKPLRDTIARAARASVEPPIEVEIAQVSHAGYTLILCTVPKGTQVLYQAGGRVVQRQHDQNVSLRPPEVIQLGIQRGLIHYELTPVAGATLDDLDLDAVQTHLEYAASRRLRAFLEAAEDDLPPDPQGLLKARGAVVATPASGLVPTVAGILFFGRHPQQFFDHSNITITRVFGTDTSRGYRERVDIVGRLPDLIDQAVDYIWAIMDHASQIQGAPSVLPAAVTSEEPSRAVRVEIPEYPLAVVRELVTNAVAHRAYENLGSHIRISMFEDRLELASPGGLAGHITLANILHEQFSRNPKIVRLLLERGFVEEEGMGLDNVYRWLANEGRPAPEIRETGGGVIVRLPSPFAAHRALPETASTPAPLPTRHPAALPPTPQPSRTRDQQIIQGYIAQHGRATLEELLTLLPDRGRRTVQYAIKDLIAQGILERHGGGPTMTYTLRAQTP